MSPGSNTESYPAFAHTDLRENPGKKPQPELNSATRVQRRIQWEWNVDPPTRKSIYEWNRTLRDNGRLISKTGKHPKKHVAEMTVDEYPQQLKPDDCRKRANFCDEVIRRIDENLRYMTEINQHYQHLFAVMPVQRLQYRTYDNHDESR
ncbi:hypothetical protein ANN_13428 [Periplaneta americana]|uniref:Uncharacterized protein n=1 Tax=Periplaneta americana TaxID=6978 RepID=A0ABQ8TLD3_PERAM|nr:hypothetical protein ANN_13428 [Periplaneta americana]